MYIHKHVIDERPRAGVFVHKRIFLRLNTKTHRDEDAREILGGHIEIVLRRPDAECALGFEVGTRGSETPFDGRIKLFGQALYWGVNQGGKLAESLSQRWLNRLQGKDRRDTKYDGRKIEAYIYSNDLRPGNADLVWSLWTPKNHGLRRGSMAEWRSGRLDLNPLNHIYGEPKYTYETVDERRIWIDMPEMMYPVRASLQAQSFGRPKSKRRETKWVVDVDAAESKGIPDRYDPSGGYKGDRVWGFGVGLPHRRDDWDVDAKALIEAKILTSRAKTGFREPLPLDAD